MIGKMAEKENQLQPFGGQDVEGQNAAIEHLKQALAEGKYWYIAIL